MATKKCEHDRFQCAVCKPEITWKMYAYKAQERGLSFSLDLPTFERLTSSACRYCDETPSLGIDRRDSRLGYYPENSFSCCWPCNRSKSYLPEREWLDHVLKIAAC